MPRVIYLTAIKELFDRCNKYIDAKGDYVEKQVVRVGHYSRILVRGVVGNFLGVLLAIEF